MRNVATSVSAWLNTGMCPLKYVTWPSFFMKANWFVMWVTPSGNMGSCSWGIADLVGREAKLHGPAAQWSFSESPRFGHFPIAVEPSFPVQDSDAPRDLLALPILRTA